MRYRGIAVHRADIRMFPTMMIPRAFIGRRLSMSKLQGFLRSVGMLPEYAHLLFVAGRFHCFSHSLPLSEQAQQAIEYPCEQKYESKQITEELEPGV